MVSVLLGGRRLRGLLFIVLPVPLSPRSLCKAASETWLNIHGQCGMRPMLPADISQLLLSFASESVKAQWLWGRSGSAVECRNLDRANPVTNTYMDGDADGDTLWRCYATTNQNPCMYLILGNTTT